MNLALGMSAWIAVGFLAGIGPTLFTAGVALATTKPDPLGQPTVRLTNH